MKSLKAIFPIALILILTACGGKNESADQNLTPLQNQAVTYVKKHLNKGDKLESYQVVEEPMPASILEQPFLNFRNIVFKAGLDYQSCKTRGLEGGMKTAEEKLVNARTQIIETENFLTQNIGSSNSVIVLAKVKTPRSHDGNLQSLVAVFDPSTMENTEWIPVTTPVQNNVALVICANDSTLFEYAREQNHETKMLAAKVSDPVLKFVLEAKAL